MILGIIKDLAEGRRFEIVVCVALSLSAFGLALANNQEIDGMIADGRAEQAKDQAREQKIDRLIVVGEHNSKQVQALIEVTQVILEQQKRQDTEIMRLRDSK